MKEIRVLLVEDDMVDAMAIERAFKVHRILNKITRANDGLEALEMLRNNKIEKPYIILLDLQMPRMNGIEFLKEIRNDAELSSSVIFVLTTSDSEEDIVKSYNFQVAGYLVKDEMGTDFLEVINLLEGYWKVVHLPN